MSGSHQMAAGAAFISARTRLLRELDRAGASGEFLRQYFLSRSELSPEDLRAISSAVDDHLASWHARMS